MQFFALSGDAAMLSGFRLVGINGKEVKTENELKTEIANILKNKDIAVLLLSEGLVNLCRGYILNLKLKLKMPLIVEIPDDLNLDETFEKDMADYIYKATGMSFAVT